MKQLHRQSSLSKQNRPHHHRTSLSRSLASYLLREQRLLFVLLGFLLASSFFLLYPSLTPHPNLLSSSARATDTATTKTHRGASTVSTAAAAARRLPVGIRKTSLRVVVSGGAGFVGSHLVDKLLARGDSVIVVDNFFTGRKDNVAHHLTNPRFELIRHDVVEPILLEVDQIYHLACPASPVHYKFNPIKTIKTNVMGTLNMLGLAKSVGARFLLTSTSEVYGDPLEHPQKESYWGHVNPIDVRSCYDEGKRTAETLTMDYHCGAGVEVRIARIFNTYGPRMCLDDGRVVSNFVAQAGWCDSQGTVDDVRSKIHMRHEGAIKRERAIAYALSHQVFWKQRGQWNAISHCLELFRNIQRFVSNAYMDSEKQNALNVFLGHFQPQEGRPPLKKVPL